MLINNVVVRVLLWVVVYVVGVPLNYVLTRHDVCMSQKIQQNLENIQK